MIENSPGTDEKSIAPPPEKRETGVDGDTVNETTKYPEIANGIVNDCNETREMLGNFWLVHLKRYRQLPEVIESMVEDLKKIKGAKKEIDSPPVSGEDESKDTIDGTTKNLNFLINSLEHFGTSEQTSRMLETVNKIPEKCDPEKVDPFDIEVLDFMDPEQATNYAKRIKDRNSETVERARAKFDEAEKDVIGALRQLAVSGNAFRSFCSSSEGTKDASLFIKIAFEYDECIKAYGLAWQPVDEGQKVNYETMEIRAGEHTDDESEHETVSKVLQHGYNYLSRSGDEKIIRPTLVSGYSTKVPKE